MAERKDQMNIIGEKKGHDLVRALGKAFHSIICCCCNVSYSYRTVL